MASIVNVSGVAALQRAPSARGQRQSRAMAVKVAAAQARDASSLPKESEEPWKPLLSKRVAQPKKCNMDSHNLSATQWLDRARPGQVSTKNPEGDWVFDNELSKRVKHPKRDSGDDN